MIDRDTFYRRADGREMTSQEMLAHLLVVGNLTSADAAALIPCSAETIDSYRKPSSSRPVPEHFLAALERFVLARLTHLASAAGYHLRKVAQV